MARDSEFAAQVEEARREADAALEGEIHRRGVSDFEEERVDLRGRVSVVRAPQRRMHPRDGAGTPAGLREV